MKIIFSFIDFNFYKKENLEYIIKLAAISNFFAQKHGYSTCLFTDEKSEKFFKNIEYNEIELFDQKIVDNLPKPIWSLGKLLAISKIKEPFLHLDFDILIFKNIENIYLNKDFICLHKEPWIIIDKKILYDSCKDLGIKNINSMSLNCGLIGGQNFDIINHKSHLIIEYALKNKNKFDKLYEEIKSINKKWALAVIFEQILFTNLVINSLNINYSNSLIIQETDYNAVNEKLAELGILHLLDKKFENKTIEYINKLILYYNIKY